MDKPTLDDIFLRCVKIQLSSWGTTHIVWDKSIATFRREDGETWGHASRLIQAYPTCDWQLYAPPAPEPQDCPFCGSPGELQEWPDETWVECISRACEFCGPDRPTEAEAIEAWNRIQLKGTEP